MMPKGAARRIERATPIVRSTYALYRANRSSQFVVFEKPKGRDGSKKLVSTLWPTGILHWPRDGGTENQSFLTFRLFTAFQAGEQSGAQRMLDK